MNCKSGILSTLEEEEEEEESLVSSSSSSTISVPYVPSFKITDLTFLFEPSKEEEEDEEEEDEEDEDPPSSFSLMACTS